MYRAHRAGPVVHLADPGNRIDVSIVTAVGHRAYSMLVNGHEVLYFPCPTIDDFIASPAGYYGVSLLAPWANRLDETAFWANGRRHEFDLSLGNIKGPTPIHGVLTHAASWQVVEAAANEESAWLTSRLEVVRPEWLRQWPLPHTIEMTYRLTAGRLEIATAITNHAPEPMPVAIGYHPYFQLTDTPREAWKLSVPARTHWLLDERLLPTGRTEEATRVVPAPQSLRGRSLDDVFSGLTRDPRGFATVVIEGRSQRLEVGVGPNYKALVIYAPEGRPFICVEPMAGITNAVNLAHRGGYDELQSVAPGGTWREQFWIRPSGF